jgi:hypothetical protein
LSTVVDRGGRGTANELTGSQREWLRVRQHMREHRYDLAVAAAQHYPEAVHVAGTPLLSTADWVPDKPVPLGAVALQYFANAAPAAVTGHEPAAADCLPVRPDGTRYTAYSEVIAEMAPPAVFEDRPTYRLLGADLAGSPRLAFGPGSYFAGIDVGDTCAHEYTAAGLGKAGSQPVRAAVGDPCDPTRRPVNLAISALTLRYDRTTDTATFPLHARDAAAVGHAGGMYQVLPVGVFQPAGAPPWNTGNDFDLWRCLLREYAEELLGAGEDYDADTAPIDYDAWPFAAAMTGARRDGRIRAHCLGLGVDPLTLATDLLAAVTIDAATYDELFGAAVETNAEGTVTAAVPFTAETVERYAAHEPTQAAGAALLRLAWQHRTTLLS